MFMVPRVTMNGGIFVFATIPPFIAPNTVAIRTPTRSAPAGCKPLEIRSAQ